MGVYSTSIQSGAVFAALGVVVVDEFGGAYLAHVDLLNKYVWRSAVGPSNPARGAEGALRTASTSAFVTLDGAWVTSASVRACGVDTVSYGGGACAPVHCKLASPSGAHTLRAFGELGTGCAAGHSADGAGGCAQCPLGAYCEGGAAALTLCPAPSTTTASVGATSAAACVCRPGYYTYPGLCSFSKKLLKSYSNGTPTRLFL